MTACEATAAAGPRHFEKAETFGHVCIKTRSHDVEHLCACRFRWDATGHWHGPNRHEGPCTGGAPGDLYLL